MHISFDGKTRREKPLGKARHSWEDNSKMGLREIGLDGVYWIHWAQDRDQWSAFVNTVLNLYIL
jgi:hypothetical protein